LRTYKGRTTLDWSSRLGDAFGVTRRGRQDGGLAPAAQLDAYRCTVFRSGNRTTEHVRSLGADRRLEREIRIKA
jgi:hypothetical protein